MTIMDDMRSAKVLTMINLTGGSVVEALVAFLQTIPPEAEVSIVELPELGIPRLGLQGILPSEQTILPAHRIDQWMQDMEQQRAEPLTEYGWHEPHRHFYILHPDQTSDENALQGIQSNDWLLHVPLILKALLVDTMDYIVLVSQGTLLHSLTIGALRIADAVMLVGIGSETIAIHERYKQRLVERYGLDGERIFLYSSSPPRRRKDIGHLSRMKQLIDQVHGCSSVPLFWAEEGERSAAALLTPLMGLSDPMASFGMDFDWRALRTVGASSSSMRQEGVMQLTMDFDVTPSFPLVNPTPRRTDDRLYLNVKRHLCEQGIQSADVLRKHFGVRKQRMTTILAQLADEGMLRKPDGPGMSYTFQWSKEQVQMYLFRSVAAPVPLPVPVFSE